MELNEVLHGSAETPPAPEPMPEPAPPPDPVETGDTPPEPEPQPRDEHGRFAPRAPQAASEPAPPAGRQDPGPIPIQALLDERDRRQRAERELEEMRRRYARPPEPPPAPDMFQDPDAFREHLRQEMRGELEAERQREITRRLNWSVEDAEERWPDYREAEQAFLAVARANPALGEQMAASHHPAAFAYKLGKQAMALREYGPDPSAYRQRLVGDDALFQQMLEQRGLSLQQLQQPPQPAPAPQPQLAFPSSLSTARSAAPRQSGVAYSGPTPLVALGNPALRMG